MFETYTQTEFEHPPPGVRITKNEYKDSILIDENLNVLGYRR